MRIHHLNCGSMCAWGGRLMDGRSRGARAHLVCHCLAVETSQGLVLIDTGLGLRDAAAPYPRLSRFYVGLLGLRLDPQETAVRQIETLGFAPADVRHIVLTHLDFDHAGGLEDFPQATVHVLADELTAARAPRGFVGKRRYRDRQWDEVSQWQTYEPVGERWFGFEAVRQLRGLPPEFLFVPLIGHTRGHAGVALQTDRGWLLHAGDAYFYRDEMAPAPRCTPGLQAYQTLMEVDRRSRLANQGRLRQLAQGSLGEVGVFCAHDPVEYERWRAAPPAALTRAQLAAS